MRTILSDCVAELTMKAVQLRRQCPSLREGQALMAALQDYSPQLYQDLTNSQADPFYDNALVPAFWMKLGERIQIHAEREARDGGQAETV